MRDSQSQDLWKELVEYESSYLAARMRFSKECKDKVSIWRVALGRPSERGTALRLLLRESVETRLNLIGELFSEASVGHSDIQLVRDVLLSIPNDSLRKEFEERLPILLKNAGEEEYRRLLELIEQVDSGDAMKLALAASKNNDEAIREAGDDFLKRIL